MKRATINQNNVLILYAVINNTMSDVFLVLLGMAAAQLIITPYVIWMSYEIGKLQKEVKRLVVLEGIQNKTTIE